MKVILGFKVDSAEPYELQIHHTAFTGMSDLSGKTTAQEAKFHREAEVDPKRKILIFLTKRGEKTFLDANRVKPFYRPQGDWEHVRGLLEASWHEKLKFETPWLYDICKYPTPAKSEEEVFQRLGEAIKKGEEPKTGKKLKDFDLKIYTHLYAYLEKIIPVIRASKDQFSDELELKPGLNVMDLTPWYEAEEVQTLCIASCMRIILARENDTDLGLPEAWKMLPQGRNTPVKLLFEKYIREGATNGNFLTIDAQDLGGVDKTHLRQVSIWVMGKMMQSDEVERILKQTLGADIPPEKIQKAKLGHFIVANGIKNTVDEIYVWPWDTPQGMAIAVAKGALEPEVVKNWILEKRQMAIEKARMEAEDFGGWMETVEKMLKEHSEQQHKELTGIYRSLEQTNKRIDNLADKFSGLEGSVSEQIREVNRRTDALVSLSNDIVRIEQKMRDFQEWAEKLPRQTIEGEATIGEIRWMVKVQPPKVEFKAGPEPTTIEGRVIWLEKEGVLENWRTQSDIEKEFETRGWVIDSNPKTQKVFLGKALASLVKQHFLGRRKNPSIHTLEYKRPDLVNFIE